MTFRIPVQLRQFPPDFLLLSSSLALMRDPEGVPESQMDLLLCEDVRKLISGHSKRGKNERSEPSSCKTSIILNKINNLNCGRYKSAKIMLNLNPSFTVVGTLMRLKDFAADYLHIWMKTPAASRKEDRAERREERGERELTFLISGI
uniref:Uncharacterized protein n=1 Tax=Cucumis melo TaxID=3656 RepID=A0A9I9E8B3_CUCME